VSAAELVLPATLRLALGAVLGFGIGLTGVGGGVLVVPALCLLLGLPMPTAVGTASAYSCLTKIYAVVEHWRLKSIDITASMNFLIGAIPGSIGAAVLVKLQADDSRFADALGWFIIGTILLSGLIMIGDGWRRRRLGDRGNSTVPQAHPSLGRRIVGIVLGFITGILIGATSVGGGVLVIPVLVLCFALPMARTVGSSIFIAVVLTLVSTIVYAFVGKTASQVQWFTAVTMAVGSLAGVAYGSRLSARLSERWLHRAVVTMILLAAGAMLLAQALDIGAGAPDGQDPTGT